MQYADPDWAAIDLDLHCLLMSPEMIFDCECLIPSQFSGAFQT